MIRTINHTVQLQQTREEVYNKAQQVQRRKFVDTTNCQGMPKTTVQSFQEKQHRCWGIKGVFLTPIYPTLIINPGMNFYLKSVLSLRWKFNLRVILSNLQYNVSNTRVNICLKMKSNCNDMKLKALKSITHSEITTKGCSSNNSCLCQLM